MENKKILDISICIACHPPYIKYLKNLLFSIEHSTCYPQECIIGLSETNNNDKNILEKKLNKKYNFNIIITNNSKKCYQAENRNRAIKLATTKYITICDADDIVHYKRLEIIYNSILKYNSLCLLHSYCAPDEKYIETIKKNISNEVYFNNKIIDKMKQNYLNNLNNKNININWKLFNKYEKINSYQLYLLTKILEV